METMETLEQVRSVLGNPNPLTYQKIKARLNDRMRAFIATSPLLMLATVDQDGFPSVSPKGDGPGFVKVQDDATLLFPERKGNRLAFTFENLLARPRVGLIFMAPGTPETLRVQGECRILRDPALCRALASDTHDALLVVEIKVTRCYFHCAKAFLRSRAWTPDTWAPRQRVSFGEEILGTSPTVEEAVRQMDEGVSTRYQTDL